MAAISPKETTKTMSLRVVSIEKISMVAHFPKTPISLSKNVLNLKKNLYVAV